MVITAPFQALIGLPQTLMERVKLLKQLLLLFLIAWNTVHMLRLLNIPFLDIRVIGMVKKSMSPHICVEAKSN